MYQTASEVIREGLRLLKERDEARASLKADIQVGLDQLARGEYFEYDEHTTKDLVKDIKARGRKRLREERLKTAHR
jgi:antitoxin ParD1/3/4